MSQPIVEQVEELTIKVAHVDPGTRRVTLQLRTAGKVRAYVLEPGETLTVGINRRITS